MANIVSGVVSALAFILAVGLIALVLVGREDATTRFISVNLLVSLTPTAVPVVLHGIWFVVCARIYRKWLRISFGQAARVVLAQLLACFGVVVAIFLLFLVLLDFWERIPRG